MVYNEQFRKYDMNELERMLRMKEQDIKKGWPKALIADITICMIYQWYASIVDGNLLKDMLGGR